MSADLATVHYVTQDSIQNLQIRVTLTRLSADRVLKELLPDVKAGFDQGRDGAPFRRDASLSRPPPASEPGGPTRGLVPDDPAVTPASSSSDVVQRQPRSGQGAPPAKRQWPITVSRTFAWQDKVYSKAELVVAQGELREAQQRQRGPAQGRFPGSKRTAKLGSSFHISPERLLAEDPEGSILFTYCQNDPFVDRAELTKSVTTSSGEGQNHLMRLLLRNPRTRQQVLGSFRAMYIMADLGDEHTVAGCNEHVLVCVKAYGDGSFDMRPGFSTGRTCFRFEDDNGGMYEYSVECASSGAAPLAERRATKLTAAVSACADDLRRHTARMDLTPLPGPSPCAVRLALMAEIVSAARFRRDHLYVEYQIQYPPDVWRLEGAAGDDGSGAAVGRIKGVTHVSRMVQYPATGDPGAGRAAPWVAHFAHPVEAEWVAQEAPPPGSWPRLLFQVCTLDAWDRHTTEGYGWLQLGPTMCPGAGAHQVPTWKPLGSLRDRQQAFFVGGSPELEDAAYAALSPGYRPSGGAPLNKYGFKTEASGTLTVRINTLLQMGSGGGGGGGAQRGAAAPGRSPRRRHECPGRRRADVSLAVVLERARMRLEEARGGEVAVRPGLASQAPFVRRQPADVQADEGGIAEFTVAAGGVAPLRHQWLKGGKRLAVATSNAPTLILVGLVPADAGAYSCEVSNKDGSVTSAKALLTVRRALRPQRGSTLTSVDESEAAAGGRSVASVPHTSRAAQGSAPRLYGFGAAESAGQPPALDEGVEAPEDGAARRSLGGPAAAARLGWSRSTSAAGPAAAVRASSGLGSRRQAGSPSNAGDAAASGNGHAAASGASAGAAGDAGRGAGVEASSAAGTGAGDSVEGQPQQRAAAHALLHRQPRPEPEQEPRLQALPPQQRRPAAERTPSHLSAWSTRAAAPGEHQQAAAAGGAPPPPRDDDPAARSAPYAPGVGSGAQAGVPVGAMALDAAGAVLPGMEQAVPRTAQLEQAEHRGRVAAAAAGAAAGQLPAGAGAGAHSSAHPGEAAAPGALLHRAVARLPSGAPRSRVHSQSGGC